MALELSSVAVRTKSDRLIVDIEADRPVSLVARVDTAALGGRPWDSRGVVSVALATFAIIVLVGWVIGQIVKDVKRDRRRRRSGKSRR